MLSPEALSARKLGIGSSDARRIVDGEWYSLWLEKTSRVKDKDLSGVWAVQLGIATERLNLDWYERKNKVTVHRRGFVCCNQEYPFLRATFDGIAGNIVVEAKHVNSRSDLDTVVERYTPQVVHQMIVLGTTLGDISIIIGSEEPTIVRIPYDDFWAAEYIANCRKFWSYVESDTPPPGAPVPLPEPPPPEKMRRVDMTGNNEWGSFAADWLANRKPAKLFDMAATGLKGLVERDVGYAAGHGVEAKRNKAGSVSIKEM